MPEYLRALAVILSFATAVFLLAKAPACAVATRVEDFERRRNLWFATTLIAFVAHNFWVYIIGVAAVLLFGVQRERNKVAMFFFLLLALPPISQDIAGIAGIRHFFSIDYIRLLALCVLLPAFGSLRKEEGVEPFGKALADQLLVSYILLNFVLMLPVSTFTHTLRYVFYAFTDIFLPYYVVSRSIKDVQAFRDGLMSFVIAALVLSAVAIFEYGKHWLLYGTLVDALGVHWAGGGYLERETVLRAQGTAGQPIPLGYVFAVAIGLLLFFKPLVRNVAVWTLAISLIAGGLAASLSRGPWLGAAAIVLVFVAAGPRPVVRLAMLSLIATMALAALLQNSAGYKLLEYLPFVGTIDEGGVTYRQRLFEIAMNVILERPFFGAYDYIYSPAMQELKQGQGIIDIVNSYLGVALSSGLVGLSLFVGFFVTIVLGILQTMRAVADRKTELFVLGQTLFACLVGILVMIATVSSISFIPVIYWSLAGLGVAYIRMLRRAKAFASPRIAEIPSARRAFTTQQ